MRTIATVAAVTVLALLACSDQGRRESREAAALRPEFDRLRATNAVLRARLSVAEQDEPYLVLDLPERQLRLELRGLVLTRSEISAVKLNRRARRISRDTTRIAFCEEPFVLRGEDWYEDVRTLALKDSSAVMSRPDTTGLLAEQVRRSRVLALLQFDRDLAIAVKGQLSAQSFGERLKGWFTGFWRQMRPGSGIWRLRTMRRAKILIELRMDPGLVRSLAPNVEGGTRLVLRF